MCTFVDCSRGGAMTGREIGGVSRVGSAVVDPRGDRIVGNFAGVAGAVATCVCGEGRLEAGAGSSGVKMALGIRRALRNQTTHR